MTHVPAQSGEVVEIRQVGNSLAEARTTTLVKEKWLELVRLVLLAGKEMATHTAPGPIVVQCLEGHIAFTCAGITRHLKPGQFFFLPKKEPHSLKALEDSSLLLTILPCNPAVNQVDESSQESFPASDSPAWTGAAVS